jgi:hypothetical protein
MTKFFQGYLFWWAKRFKKGVNAADFRPLKPARNFRFLSHAKDVGKVKASTQGNSAKVARSVSTTTAQSGKPLKRLKQAFGSPPRLKPGVNERLNLNAQGY